MYVILETFALKFVYKQSFGNSHAKLLATLDSNKFDNSLHMYATYEECSPQLTYGKHESHVSLTTIQFGTLRLQTRIKHQNMNCNIL
jgi:hypothetical protein